METVFPSGGDVSTSTPTTRVSAREPSAANAVWRIVIMNFGNLDHRHLNNVLHQCFGATCIPRWIDAGEDGAFAHEDIGAPANHDLTIQLYDTEMVRTGPAVKRILATSPKTPLLTIANVTANFIGQHDIDCLPLEQLTPALLWATTRYLSEKILADGQLDINRELTKDLAAAQHHLIHRPRQRPWRG
ncbi:MAG: hypothetical protein VCF08_18415 [Alphaproteobacteria bacterium]